MDGAARQIPSLDDLLDYGETFVRQRMLSDGEFTPTIHAVDNAGDFVVFMLPDYGGLRTPEKMRFCATLGRIMRPQNCVAYVVMWEAWMTPLEDVTPEIATRLLSGEPPPRKEAHRQEAVWLAASDVVGHFRSRCFMTVRADGGKVTDLTRRGDERTAVSFDAAMMRLLVTDEKSGSA